MAYVVESDIAAMIPQEFFTQALDDTGSGTETSGLFPLIAQLVSDEIDSEIGVRYAVPLIPNPATGLYPKIVMHAARIYAAEMCYNRRGLTGDKNPWSAQAKIQRDKLRLVALGELPLDPNIQRANPSASTTTDFAKTTPSPARQPDVSPSGIVFAPPGPGCGTTGYLNL